MIDAATLTTLIPGSVWLMTKRNKTTEATVLMVTNENLTAEIQKRHPPQVVFLSERGGILSQDVEMFLRNRTFQGVNDQVDEAFRNLMEAATEVDSDDEGEGFDNIILPNLAVPQSEGVEEQAEEPEEDARVFTFLNAEGVPDETLSEAFFRYNEVREGASVIVGVGFLMTDITQEALETAFRDPQCSFSIVSRVAGEQTTTVYSAGSWTYCSTRIEIGSVGNTYAWVNLLAKLEPETPEVLPEPVADEPKVEPIPADQPGEVATTA